MEFRALPYVEAWFDDHHGPGNGIQVQLRFPGTSPAQAKLVIPRALAGREMLRVELLAGVDHPRPQAGRSLREGVGAAGGVGIMPVRYRARRACARMAELVLKVHHEHANPLRGYANEVILSHDGQGTQRP